MLIFRNHNHDMCRGNRTASGIPNGRGTGYFDSVRSAKIILGSNTDTIHWNNQRPLTFTSAPWHDAHTNRRLYMCLHDYWYFWMIIFPCSFLIRRTCTGLGSREVKLRTKQCKLVSIPLYPRNRCDLLRSKKEHCVAANLLGPVPVT